MVNEQDKILEELRLDTQMEIDAKEYYLKVSQSSGNQADRKLSKL